MKVMMVDDESDQIFMVKMIFEESGMDVEVISANDGPSCFELLEKGEKPDLFLLDLMMPGMSGWDIHDKLRSKDSPWAEIPIIFLTAVTDENSLDVGNWFGTDYIEKPFKQEDFIKRIKQVLQKDE